MTRLAKPEKKAGKGNEPRGMYANQRVKAIGYKARRSLIIGMQRQMYRARIAL